MDFIAPISDENTEACKFNSFAHHNTVNRKGFEPGFMRHKRPYTTLMCLCISVYVGAYGQGRFQQANPEAIPDNTPKSCLAHQEVVMFPKAVGFL